MGNDNVKDYPPYLDYPKPRKPITNADRIRSYTGEELAELFTHLCCPYSLGGKVECNVENKGCKACWLDWLKEEVVSDG